LSIYQGFARHLQLRLRIFLEDLHLALVEHLSHPLIGYASGTQPRGIRGTKTVDPKVGNLARRRVNGTAYNTW
jgi:hypothetical protein